MLKKLLAVYENSMIYYKQPEIVSEEFYYFTDADEKAWISIPKTSINEPELQLLKTLFLKVEERPKPSTSAAKEWYEFLLLNGSLPHHLNGCFRIIQFHITGDGVNQMEVEDALKGFFTEEVVIVWENKSRGMVVEQKKAASLMEEEFQAMLETMESDFYVKMSFFRGKQHVLNDKLRNLFREEKEFFSFAIDHMESPRIYTYERVFPAFLAAHLPLELKLKVIPEIFDLFRHDPEMFATIKVFLENNSNASLTAKKLYIHRNTLQYRIDKFVEKTEIDLKEFYGAFTVFLACLLFEHHA
ncbi:helix-turn-helix domain-containing protein [Bacillus sp. BRMEA1]|uniref:PucR family transcriptional regulator n=1 Tax=Neobacillus endophyticus TaxID=2738405 RepID=UPI00156696B0|nr:helix-turn-helix domain-containing protein [Neobacillus endophyticus]NRD78339.1 helix-turn-helix domain-containing protein [Neobacillus endophyticus]